MMPYHVLLSCICKTFIYISLHLSSNYARGIITDTYKVRMETCNECVHVRCVSIVSPKNGWKGSSMCMFLLYHRSPYSPTGI